MHAYCLEYLHQNDQQNHCYNHDIYLITVISVTNSDISKTASAYSASHGRITKYCTDCDSSTYKNGCSCLYQQYFEDNCKSTCSHGLCCLNDTTIHFFQGRLYHSTDKRCCCYNQRHYCRCRAIALTYDQSCKRNQYDQKNQEWNTSDNIGNKIQNLINYCIGSDACLVCNCP